MKSCLVIEDDYLFYLETESVLKKLGYTKIENVKNISEVAISIEQSKFDLIISDMILESGELAWDYFKQNKTDIPIIFTTVMLDKDLFNEIQAFKSMLYLVKPVNQLTLESAILTSEDNSRKSESTPNLKGIDIQQHNDTIFVRSQGEIYRIAPKDIQFVKSDGNYCIIQTPSKKFVVRSSIRNMIRLINDDRFIQVQRAYLINIKFIDKIIINRNTIQISNYDIPIGRKYKKALIDHLKAGDSQV